MNPALPPGDSGNRAAHPGRASRPAGPVPGAFGLVGRAADDRAGSNGSAHGALSAPFRAGEAFNPYRMFTGLFIPEGLTRCTWISAGAKLAWGRLARYAGEDGRCHPTVQTLGDEIGVGERQAQKYIAEL